MPDPSPDPAPDGRRRPAPLLADLNATAWVEDAEPIPGAMGPNQDATRWEMEVPQVEGLDDDHPSSSTDALPPGATLAADATPTPVYDPGSGTWGQPGGPPPSVRPLASGPPNLGVDPREALAKKLKLLNRRYPSFAPHSEFAFKRLEVLGEGGMGVVHRVLDKRLGRDAALKVLRVETQSWGNRFRREIEITAKLDHPAIPAVYEAGTTAGGEQYLLMRLIHGVELKDRIEAYHAGGRTPEGLRELLDHLLRLGEAVAYAHKRGVVHRDLKPANVMVGRFGEVFVMDWGLARILEDDADESLHHLEIETLDSGMTVSGSVMGTPGYMPPEQARGEEVDARADVFALGAILTEILTGEPPIGLGNSSSELVAATVDEKITLPIQRRKDVAPELNSLAEAALAPDASVRLADGSAFVRELRAYLAGEPLSVHDYSFRERLFRSARNQTGLLMGIMIVMFLGGGASLVGLWALNQEFEEAALERSAQEDKLKAQLAAIRQRHAEEQRAEVEKERQRMEEAMSLLAEATSLAEGGSPEIVEGKVEAALARASSRFLLWTGSDVLVRSKNLEGAIGLLERSAQEHPPGYRALYRVHVLVQRQRGREQETEALRRLLRLAKERGETNVFTHLAAGLRARRRRDYEQARESFRLALEADPNFAEARYEHGRIAGVLAESQGDFKTAEAEYGDAIRANSARPGAWAQRARLRIERGAYREAVEDAERLVRLLPDSADARALLAWAMSFKDDLPKAILAHKEAFARDPNHPMAFAARAQVRLRRKRLVGARADLVAGLKANPDPRLERRLKALLARLDSE
jgi:serine/threonine protein kinase/Tfp pilus assembly protein PilF